MIEDTGAELVLDYAFDESPETVWRAVNIAEFRRRWLPDEALADPAPIETVPGREVRYRMKEDRPAFPESLVTFRITPDGAGGTRLRIVHERIGPPRLHRPPAANANVMSLRLAA